MFHMDESTTFGRQLRQFALSIDLIDRSHFAEIQQMVIGYVTERLGAVQVALFTGVPLKGRVPGIAEAEGWSSPPFPIDEQLAPLRDSSGKYQRQLALALGEQRDLWVVSGTEEPLHENNPGKDLLTRSRDEALPTFYPAPSSRESKTAIAWNAKSVRPRRAAVLDVEWNRVVRPSPALKGEIDYLADARGLLQAAHEYTKERSIAGTARAIQLLREYVTSAPVFDVKPSLFFAYADRADTEVVNAAQEVLKDFARETALVDWRAERSSGSIWEYLTKAIGGATYGIAYLSEPRRGSAGPKFQDNLNVVMEAGMLQASTAMRPGTVGNWIPIRERDSGDAFFNVAGLRMLRVPRSDDGALDVQGFKKELRESLEAMFKTEPGQ